MPRKQFTREEFEKGLAYVSWWLGRNAASRGVESLPINVTLVGGAVGVLCGDRCRPSTEDVDIYNSDGEITDILEEAGDACARHFLWEDAMGWLNGSVGAIILADPWFTVMLEDPVEEVVYNNDNLRLMAAPPQFNLLSKLMRMTNDMRHSQLRGTDVLDAARSLDNIVKYYGRDMTLDDLLGWHSQINTVVSKQILTHIQSYYQSKRGRLGINLTTSNPSINWAC